MPCDITDNASKKTALYRHFDEGGDLLYVGISAAPMSRTAQHSANSVWFCDVSRIDIDWFESREAALVAERKAIRTERPKFNIKLKRDEKREWGVVPILRDVSIYEWLKIQKISAATLAAQVGVTRQYIWALAKGASLPRVDLAVRIEDATGGAVPVRCWGQDRPEATS